MRTLIKFSFVFMMLALVASCKNDKTKAAKAGDAKEKAVPTATAKSYSVTAGKVTWTASKVTGAEHSGTIDIKSGVFAAEGSNLKSGNFVIDIATLKNTDMAGSEGQAKLEGHLKSGDFFEVEKFPTAAFAVTSVSALDTDEANCEITGNLTLKGVTKSVKFPALVVAKADGTLTAISDKFAINRNDWGMKYGSGLAGAVGDNVINDNVTLRVELSAK